MKKHIIMTALFIFTLSVFIQPVDFKDFSPWVKKLMKEHQVPGMAIAVVKDGKVILAKGFGYRNVKKKLPVTADTLFAIGSCTKAFTATLPGMLADDGKLDWDPPVPLIPASMRWLIG